MGRWAGRVRRWHHVIVILAWLLAISALPVSGQSNDSNATPPASPNPPPQPSPPPPGWGYEPSVPQYRASRGVAYPAVPMRLRRETSVMLQVQLEGPGIVRYIATPEGYSVEVNATTGERNFSPSVAEVRDGSWGTGVLAAGIINVTVANTTFTANVTNLTKIGRNDLWVATSAPDDLATAGAVAMLDATTRDATPPAFVPWYNASTPITYLAPDGVDVAVALDEPGWAYVHVLAPERQVPSGEQVKERALANYTWSKWTEVTEVGKLYGSAVFGLQSATRYAVYLTVEDLWEPERNILEPAMRWEFYTFDDVPPRGAISLGTVTNEGFTIMGESNKNGTVRFVVVPSANEKKPTFWDVMFGVGYGQKQPTSTLAENTTESYERWFYGKYDDDPRMTFGPVSAKGVFNVSGVGANALGAASAAVAVGVASGSAVVEGLSSETAYDVYAVVSDAAENPATGQTINHNVTVLTILNVVTLDDTPPALIGENTTGGTVANVKPASFDLVTRLNEPGRVWYVVTPHVAPAVAVYWNDTCFDRYSHAYFKPVSGDFKLNQPPLPHIGLLDPREHEYVCPSEDAVDSGLGDRVRWIGAPTVEEVMMGVGPNRTQAAACGYVDVPTANVEVTKTIASVFDPSAEVDRCANWTAAYDENVTGGVYTAMDDRAASDAENDGRRGVGDMWVYGWYHGEYLTEKYAIGNWSKWVANASDLPAYPEHPTCRTCPRLSPEGAYDVWIVAEDDGNDPAYNLSAAGNGTITDSVATSRNRQAHATKVMVINPTDWHGPTVVMADNTTATFVPGYPKLTSLNGTAMKLEVALNESGAFVFSLRPGTNDSAALNRSQIESAAGWNVSYQALMLKPWMEEKTMTFDNYNYLHNWFLKDPPEEAKKYPDLQLGANAGVIWAKNATVPVIHVITDVPRPSSWIGEDRQGPTLAIDYFVVDEEPTRGSSLTQPNWDGSTHHLAVRMKDVLAPLWTAGPFVSGVAVPASSVDDLFLPAGSKVGSQYARLVVNATVDEGGTVYFVVCAVPATGGDEPTPTVEQVINATVCDDGSYPKIAAASFVAASNVATEWQSLGYPLVQGSKYVAYLVAADDTTTGAGYNAQDNVTVVRFTAEDMRPPVFSDFVGGAPAVVNGTSGGSLTLTLALASPGRARWVVVDGGSPATEPTRAEVVAGTGAGGSTPLARGTVVVSNESYVDSVVTTVIDVTSAGLGAVSSAAAGYSVFVATVPGDDDSYSGNGDRHEDVPSTNAAKVAPGLVVDPDATMSAADALDAGALCVGIEALGETSVTLRFAVTGAPATVAYVILRHALPAPTPAQVLAGTDSKGRAPLAAGGSDFAYTGSASVAGAANLTTAFNATAVGAGVTNLTRGTRYDIYAVAALTPVDARNGPDGAASPYASASVPPRLVKRVIRTLDETAPFFLPGFPRVGAVAPRGVTVAVRVDEAAAVWVVALPTGAPVPSAADVAAAAVHLAGANSTPAVAAANATSTSAGVASMALAGAVGDTDTMGTGLDADLGWEPMMLSLSGLSPSKRYDVYVTARDFHRDDLPVGFPAKLGTLQGRATKLLASTPDETASLVSLVPSAGSLSPPFSSELSSYRLLVPGDATAAATVSFTATSADLRWKVLADGAELKPGASTPTFIVGEVARTVVFEVEGVSAPSSYSVLLVRADAAVAAAAADDTLAFLAVELDTGERLNSTSMGGAPWPKCAMRCRPPGSPDGCLADRRGCALDPHRRLYRVVAPVAAKRATVTAVTSRPGASVRVFLGPPAAYAGAPALNSSSADEETWGLAGSVPTPMSTVVDLARVEVLSPMPEVAAIYLGVTSADGTRLTYYTIQLRRKGPGAYEGIENRPRNAQDDPPPREYDHFSHPETVSPVDRVATDNPLTFYPDEL